MHAVCFLVSQAPLLPCVLVVCSDVIGVCVSVLECMSHRPGDGMYMLINPDMMTNIMTIAAVN